MDEKHAVVPTPEAYPLEGLPLECAFLETETICVYSEVVK